MNPDLQNKIDLEAKKDSVIRDTYTDSCFTAKNAFKKGAKFVQGILQDEIERLKEDIKLHQKINTSDGKLIQSLKDENEKFREALNEIKFYNGDSSRVEMIVLKSLTQKAEE